MTLKIPDNDDELNGIVMTGDVSAGGIKASVDAHTSDPCTMPRQLVFLYLVFYWLRSFKFFLVLKVMCSETDSNFVTLEIFCK